MNSIRKHLLTAAFYGGLPFTKIGLRRILGRRKIFILMYHRVDFSERPFFEVVVKPEVFEKQIRFLKKYYEIIELTGLKRIEANRSVKKDIIVLTFDDGYRDNYTHAFPILKKYQVPATIFLATKYINTNRLLWYDKLSWILYMAVTIPDKKKLIGSELSLKIVREIIRFFVSDFSDRINVLRALAAILKGLSVEERKNTLHNLAKACGIKVWPGDKSRPMLSWEEVREMSAHGISFGSHTVSHPVLSAISTQEVHKEIVESKKIIEEQIEKPVVTFAYPFGKKEDYSSNVSKALEDLDFEYACSTIRGDEQLPLRDPMGLKRRGAPLHPYLFL